VEEGFGSGLGIAAVGRGGGDKALTVDDRVGGAEAGSEGDPEGGRLIEPNTPGVGDRSFLVGPTWGDVVSLSDGTGEVFPGGGGGDSRPKLSFMGVVPK
jgi:hypothetical protein